MTLRASIGSVSLVIALLAAASSAGCASTALGDAAPGGSLPANVAASGAPAGTPRDAPSTLLRLTGAVDKPLQFDLAALRAQPQVRRTVNGRVYEGPSLWALLMQAGIEPAGAAMNATLGSYVVATGSDGYTVVVSIGELDPAFGDKPAIVAISVDGQDLGRNGMARLILPDDRKMGRSVFRLVSLEVRRVGR